MKKLRVDLYCGYNGDRSFTEHDCFRQYENETLEELIDRVTTVLFENIEQLTFEDEGTEDD